MQFTTSVTQKGQATIPAIIRKHLGIKTNSKVVFEVKNNEVILKSAEDFFAMKGSVKSKKPFSMKAMEKAVVEAISVSYAKKRH